MNWAGPWAMSLQAQLPALVCEVLFFTTLDEFAMFKRFAKFAPEKKFTRFARFPSRFGFCNIAYAPWHLSAVLYVAKFKTSFCFDDGFSFNYFRICILSHISLLSALHGCFFIILYLKFHF
jgi:hypothetical protein